MVAKELKVIHGKESTFYLKLNRKRIPPPYIPSNFPYQQTSLKRGARVISKIFFINDCVVQQNQGPIKLGMTLTQHAGTPSVSNNSCACIALVPFSAYVQKINSKNEQVSLSGCKLYACHIHPSCLLSYLPDK